MTVHSTNANNLQAQSDSDEQAVAIEAAENDVLKRPRIIVMGQRQRLVNGKYCHSYSAIAG